MLCLQVLVKNGTSYSLPETAKLAERIGHGVKATGTMSSAPACQILIPSLRRQDSQTPLGERFGSLRLSTSPRLVNAECPTDPNSMNPGRRLGFFCRKMRSENGKGVGKIMERRLTIAEIILIAGTRVALGAGLGLLLSNRLNADQRKVVGLALALVGGLTTIPLALSVISKKSPVGMRRAA